MLSIKGSLRAVVCMAIVSTVFTGLFSSGCKKKAPEEAPQPRRESVYTNRMNDAAYVGALQSNRTQQAVQARERNELLRQLKACQERVKAGLTAGLDEAALQAALAGDPEWQRLSARKSEAEGRIQATLQEARETVRKRMEAEAQAVRAVAEGKALPADPVPAPR